MCKLNKVYVWTEAITSCRLSSAEMEYIGLVKRLCDLLRLLRLLTELGYPPTLATKLLCDNKAAINISHNLIKHDRTKHVEEEVRSKYHSISFREIKRSTGIYFNKGSWKSNILRLTRQVGHQQHLYTNLRTAGISWLFDVISGFCSLYDSPCN